MAKNKYSTKWLENNGIYEFGLKFRFIDGDYDWSIVKSIKYKYSEKLYQYMLKCKYEHECDFTRCEYDCTGSTQVRIKVRRKGRYLYMWIHTSKDV